ncbi:NmrA-like family protein (Rossmann-fold NAD(P)(+)-binding protein) [Colletotrichum sojae]|uniref:NmrA-like family protein (Rossmann-fold NAD(P)(+)-binding protein) n=1 Tax=Colletotrichum sojae TaxID=2175907 RepID=A0A8H6MX61_9PEZI|nr:NmrA-like family protein (Rossmann-fold NAD(P)(+)-binding protein) [Colletotrichum sojae]
MAFNRIAVYGHRGWAGSRIVEALIALGAPIKVLYRPGSDVSDLPAIVTTVEVDVDDEQALVDALQDVDIVISLVGHHGAQKQHAFVKAIPRTGVKLFSPSDLASRFDEEGLRFSGNKAKHDLEQAAKAAGIPTTVVLTGNFAEFALNTLALGVDIPGNRILYSGNSADERLNICTSSSTRDYVAAAYASIFASRPVSEIENRVIALTELAPTGREIAAGLAAKHGAPPSVLKHALERVSSELEDGLSSGSPLTVIWLGRKIWATGQQARLVGTDRWDVEGYEKATIDDLIVWGKLGAYREVPLPVQEYFENSLL